MAIAIALRPIHLIIEGNLTTLTCAGPDGEAHDQRDQPGQEQDPTDGDREDAWADKTAVRAQGDSEPDAADDQTYPEQDGADEHLPDPDALIGGEAGEHIGHP